MASRALATEAAKHRSAGAAKRNKSGHRSRFAEDGPCGATRARPPRQAPSLANA